MYINIYLYVYKPGGAGFLPSTVSHLEIVDSNPWKA